jgi:hypothetical protein
LSAAVEVFLDLAGAAATAAAAGRFAALLFAAEHCLQ